MPSIHMYALMAAGETGFGENWDNLEESNFTSIQQRIRYIRGQTSDDAPALMAFESDSPSESSPAVPYGLEDYLELVGWTGRLRRPDKKGFIRLSEPWLLQRLGLSELEWRRLDNEMQKEAATRLNGLFKLRVIARRKAARTVA